MTLLIFTDVSSPKYANDSGTAVDCFVVFPHIGETPVPFTAVASDPSAPHGELIFEMAKSGQFGAIMPYEPPPATPDEKGKIETLQDELNALKEKLHGQGLEVDERPKKAQKK